MAQKADSGTGDDGEKMHLDHISDTRASGDPGPIGLMVLLHGSGSTGEEMRRLVGTSLIAKLNSSGWHTIFPTAPQQPYSLANGEPWRVWLDRQELGTEAPEDSAGLAASVRLIEREMREACADLELPISNTIVGGFSMGGGVALACSALLQSRFAGAFSVGSFLSKESLVFQAGGLGQTNEILMMHGRRDEMVSFEDGVKTWERLKEIYPAARIRFEECSSLGHDFNPTVRRYILEFATAVAATMRPSISTSGVETAGDSSVAEGKRADQLPLSPFRVTWQISQQASDGCSVVHFDVPPGSETLLARFPVNANGGQFPLTIGTRRGTVACEFMSPKPAITAEAIAMRLQARLQDPSPPGMESCSIT